MFGDLRILFLVRDWVFMFVDCLGVTSSGWGWTIKYDQFRRTWREGVSTRYDLGVSVEVVTQPGEPQLLSEAIQTAVLSGTSGVLLCHSGSQSQLFASAWILDRICHPMSNCAGDSPHHSRSVHDMTTRPCVAPWRSRSAIYSLTWKLLNTVKSSHSWQGMLLHSEWKDQFQSFARGSLEVYSGH